MHKGKLVEFYREKRLFQQNCVFKTNCKTRIDSYVTDCVKAVCALYKKIMTKTKIIVNLRLNEAYHTREEMAEIF